MLKTNDQFMRAEQYTPGSDPSRYPSLAGFAPAGNRNAGTAHKKRVVEAGRLYADTISGRVDPVFLRQAMSPTSPILVAALFEQYPGLAPAAGAIGLRETMSVTDYQALFVDVLDRMYYGYYNAFPIVSKPLCKVKTLRDFRLVSRYLLDGMVSPFTKMDAAAPPKQTAMTGPVPQDGASAAVATTAPIQYQPSLYQSMASVNWRAFVNDDLGIFQDIAQRLAIQANRGISRFLTGFFVQTSGPNTALYKAAYGNLITTAYGAASSNPPLSIQGIQDAFKILAGMKDSSGEPILMTGTPIVWYGPAYAALAENLQNMLTSMISVEGGTQAGSTGFPAQFLQVGNWAVKRCQWIMDPYIPIIATSKPLTWGITISPNEVERPAVEVGFLQGFETPQIYQKVPNTQRLGGGVDPMLGDFQTMDQDTKIVSVFGGTQIDGRCTVASDGSGS
jgi:hypothetical protein